MIWIIQILSIVFGIVTAKHDGPAVLTFENYLKESEISDRIIAKFHRYNVWIKICFVKVVAIAMYFATENYLITCLSAAASGLWIWLVFDPVLNKERGRKLDYVGTNDSDGRRWIKWFGKLAGSIKAIILFSLIVIVNISIIIIQKYQQ